MQDNIQPQCILVLASILFRTFNEMHWFLIARALVLVHFGITIKPLEGYIMNKISWTGNFVIRT